MLSGVGDPAELKGAGIDVKIPLKGVGKNLQDHMSSPVAYARKEPGPLHRSMRIDRIVRELGKAYFLGKGIATDLPAGAMAFLRSQYADSLPDVQLIFISAPMTAAPYLAPFNKIRAADPRSSVPGRPSQHLRASVMTVGAGAAGRGFAWRRNGTGKSCARFFA
jgi:choline dehydrogenase-like flavoprotein